MNLHLIKKSCVLAIILLLLSGCSEQETTLIEPGTVPKKLPSTLKINRKSATYVITGIGLSGNNKVAIINNEVVVPGAEVGNGVVLKDIQPTYVTLLSGNSQYHIRPEDIQNQLDKKKD
jgi:uncharacterized lipoprotein YajG